MGVWVGVSPQHELQGGCVIGGHTQMNKQRQCKQLVHEHERLQTQATSTEAQLGLFPGEVSHVC